MGKKQFSTRSWTIKVEDLEKITGFLGKLGFKLYSWLPCREDEGDVGMERSPAKSLGVDEGASVTSLGAI